MKSLIKNWFAAAFCGVVACSLVGCGGDDATASASAAKTVTVKIGLTGDGHEQWQPAIKKLAAEGINVELINFGDYTLPNQALVDGEIDLNDFQHYAFLENETKEKNFDLTVIGETLLAPLGIYSKKITSLAELKEGDLVALPNDVTNGGRALKLFESAGLIKVKPEAGFVPSLSDVTENKLNLKFIEVEAGGIPALLPDVTIAAINGGHATANGLQPKTDAIFLEDFSTGTRNPYINVIVARTADKDNAVYKKVVAAYQTPEVAAIIDETYKGAYITVWDRTPAADTKATTTTEEKTTESTK